MSPMIIIVIILLLVGLGVGIYFMTNKKECKTYITQGTCKAPCKWDVHGYKCIGENDKMTPKPPDSPPLNNQPNGSQPSVVEELTYDKVPGYPNDVNGRNGGAIGGTWYLMAAGESPDPDTCRDAVALEGGLSYGWRKNDNSCWGYFDSTFLETYKESTALAKNNTVVGCVKKGVKVEDGCIKPLKDLNITRGATPTSPLSGSIDLGEIGEKYTMQQCGTLAKERGKTNWGYRNYRHQTNPNTCWAYNDSSELKGFKGDKTDKVHYMGCVDPTKNIKTGCV